jgi:hypothetical protein
VFAPSAQCVADMVRLQYYLYEGATCVVMCQSGCGVICRTDRVLKNIKVLPDMPERYLREEERQALEARLAFEETERIRNVKRVHVARVEAGDSSEDEAYWEAKAELDEEGSVSTRTSEVGGDASMESRSTSACSEKPAYHATRQHIQTLMGSEVRVTMLFRLMFASSR